MENEDVVGAAPTCDAPTISEWSIILLPTKVRLILETWRYLWMAQYIIKCTYWSVWLCWERGSYDDSLCIYPLHWRINQGSSKDSIEYYVRQCGYYCTLQWRHNGRDGVPSHQPHDCLFTRLFWRRSKKTSKLRVTSLCVGNSPWTGKFPAQMASNAKNVSIWWRHHEIYHI